VLIEEQPSLSTFALSKLKSVTMTAHIATIQPTFDECIGDLSSIEKSLLMLNAFL
jgi:hypothetical protein